MSVNKNLIGITATALILLSTPFFAHLAANSTPTGTIVEFRSSYFSPHSSNFRKFFHNGGANYQLTASAPVCFQNESAWARGINLWAGVDYFSKTGKSSGFGEKTEIRLAPLTLGLKYFFPSFGCENPFNFYAAGGMKYYFLRNRNHSHHVQRKINRSGMGGVLEVGCITLIQDHLILDLFTSYSFKTFRAPSSKDLSIKTSGLNVSGLNVGAGIGYQF